MKFVVKKDDDGYWWELVKGSKVFARSREARFKTISGVLSSIELMREVILTNKHPLKNDVAMEYLDK